MAQIESISNAFIAPIVFTPAHTYQFQLEIFVQCDFAFYACQTVLQWSPPDSVQPIVFLQTYCTNSFSHSLSFSLRLTLSLAVVRVKLSKLRRGAVLKLWMADFQYWACASSFCRCPLPSLLTPPSASPVPAESPNKACSILGKPVFQNMCFSLDGLTPAAFRSSSLSKHVAVHCLQ